MTDVVTVGEKGQIVIPKRLRDEFHIEKGTKLLVGEKGKSIVLKPVDLNDDLSLLLLSETSLKKTWDNKYDERWDDVL